MRGAPLEISPSEEGLFHDALHYTQETTKFHFFFEARKGLGPWMARIRAVVQRFRGAMVKRLQTCFFCSFSGPR